MITLTDVTKRFGERLALASVSATLTEKIVGLVGVNGAGKSTFMKVCAGELLPTSGNVDIDGHQPHSMRGQIGYCPQEVDLPGRFTCREFLTYLAWLRRTPRAHTGHVVRDALESVALGDRAGDKIGALSGGMRRRLVIAQALMGSPMLVLLDEPTTGLDPEQRAAVRDLLANLNVDVPIVISSHIIEDIAALADRHLFLHNGRLVHDAPSRRRVSAAELEETFLRTVSTAR